MGVSVFSGDNLTELDLKQALPKDDESKPLGENIFSPSASLCDIRRLQRFTALTLHLNGQDFHIGDAKQFAPSGSGLVLASLRRGEMTIQAPGLTETIKPADFVVIPLGSDTLLTGSDCELDCLVVDEQLKPLLPQGLDGKAPVILSALLPATSLLYQQFICFRAYTNLIQEEDVEELLPPLLMMLNTIFKRHGNSTVSASDSLLDKVRAYIKDHLLDPELSPDTVAKQLGLSRARLYRLAEPLGGIKKHIRAERLQLAHEKLLNGGEDVRSITALAFDLGFGTETAFRRAFKDAFGITPSQLRQRNKRAPRDK